VDGEARTDQRFTEREWKALRRAGRMVIVLALAAIVLCSWRWSIIGIVAGMGMVAHANIGLGRRRDPVRILFVVGWVMMVGTGTTVFLEVDLGPWRMFSLALGFLMAQHGRGLP
jgi:hypothetical protein